MFSSRQLAAILFTDIVGYTALMGADEEKAFELLRKNREIQLPFIEKYHGRWIKEIGDGILATFPGVTDGVLCAIEIHNACAAIQDLLLRIGIHQAEIIFEDNDVFGDGVNIAARIQSAAPPGAIWLSETVYQNINNKKSIHTRFVGEKVLKNVKDPQRIYEIVIDADHPEYRDQQEKVKNKNLPEKSIAVLPFVNMSNDAGQDYFSDGMAEEIINSLNHIKDLKVAGRTSSFQFRGKNIDLKELGAKLGVSTILEGSVRKQGKRLRITAQLINVEDGFHFWSQKYDREMDDIFAIQDEIALSITEQLRVTLLEKDKEKISRSLTQNAEAYELYLKGKFQVARRGKAILTAVEYFKKAIALDPDFALAYVGYAEANSLSAAYDFVPGNAVMEEAKNAAERAISLDSTMAEAWCALASYHMFFDRNWEKAREYFLRSIALDDKYAQAHAWYGMLLAGFVYGDFELAIKEGRIAIKLEPLNAIHHADLAWTFFMCGRFDEGLDSAKTGLDLDPHSFLSQRIAGLCYNALGRFDEAITSLSHFMEISGGHVQAASALIWSYCAAGRIEEAQQLMKYLEDKPASEYRAGIYYGISKARLGDLDKAMEYLELAGNSNAPQLTYLKFAPDVPESLRNDPRFQQFLSRIGLTST